MSYESAIDRRASKYAKQSKDKSPAIFKGLKKEMPATQALIMLAIFNQFPYRFIPSNQFYFTPNVDEITDQMSMDLMTFTQMANNLVGLGFLEKRNAAGGGMEYRIVFDRLRIYLG